MIRFKRSALRRSEVGTIPVNVGVPNFVRTVEARTDSGLLVGIEYDDRQPPSAHDLCAASHPDISRPRSSLRSLKFFDFGCASHSSWSGAPGSFPKPARALWLHQSPSSGRSSVRIQASSCCRPSWGLCEEVVEPASEAGQFFRGLLGLGGRRQRFRGGSSDVLKRLRDLGDSGGLLAC